MSKEDELVAELDRHADRLKAEKEESFKAFSEKVNVEIDKMNDQFFSEEAFERENRLRKWVKGLTQDSSATVSDAEELIKCAGDLENNTLFTFRGLSFIRTSTGLVDRTSNYIEALENTVIDLTDKVTPTKGFFTNLKIAFKSLLKGEL